MPPFGHRKPPPDPPQHTEPHGLAAAYEAVRRRKRTVAISLITVGLGSAAVLGMTHGRDCGPAGTAANQACNTSGGGGRGGYFGGGGGGSSQSARVARGGFGLTGAAHGGGGE